MPINKEQDLYFIYASKVSGRLLWETLAQAASTSTRHLNYLFRTTKDINREFELLQINLHPSALDILPVIKRTDTEIT
ncbi:MAG TPA: hypothetical protein VLB82_06625 [Thermodesulfobacteriota bacterium]|nr:hypothetical protein [Thermodesulfobacteriota bacterium]